MSLLSRLFRRKPKGPLTVEQAIAQGLIDPALLQQQYIPKAGFFVRYYTIAKNEFGHLLTTPKEEVHYAAWWQWRDDLRSKYLGGPGILDYKDVPTGFREPMLDLSAGVPEADYNAGRGFLIDQGLVNR